MNCIVIAVPSAWLRYFMACLAMGVCVAASGAEAPDREEQMTAAYVFNFLKFVEWPASLASDSLQVCFFGANGVRDALASATAEKRIGARKIVVRAVDRAAQIDSCQVIYVASETAAHLPARGPDGALTIGDANSFTQDGGVIRLYTESNRLRFVVNVANAKRAGLQISSNLLKLATHIEQGGVP